MKKVYVLIIFFLLTFNILPVAFNHFENVPSSVSAAATWYNADWLYRKKITIDGTLVNHTVTNFPFLIYNSSDSDLSSYAQADGDDIIFVSSGGTKLAHELDYYSNGKFSAWVNLSLTKNADYELYMYYGNSGASAQENPTGVWDSNYKCVYHFSEASGTTVQDSTANNNDSYYNGSLPTRTLSNQRMGHRQYLDGNDDWMYLSNDLHMQDEGHIMIVARASNHQSGVSEYLWYDRNAGTDYLSIFAYNDDEWQIRSEKDGGTGFLWETGKKIRDELIYIAANFKDSGEMNATMNNTYYQDLTAEVHSKPTNNIQAIGANVDNEQSEFTGYIDEFRLSSVPRTGEWLNMTYNTIFLDMFKTSAHEGYVPDLSVPSPSDGETDVLLSRQNTSIVLTSPVGSTDYTLNWYWLDGSTWEWYGRNTSCGNGTYRQTNSNFSGLSTTYQWKVNASNATAYVISTFSFTTRGSPANPTNLDGTVYGTSSLNITWSEATDADTTLIRYKANSFPTSETDGTEAYNGSNEYYNHTSYLDNYYYTLFSYNATDNIFSSGAQLVWGDLNVSVFNETGGAAITGWDIFITNPSTGTTYNSTGNNNYLLVDADDFPNGDSTTIRISKTGYRDGIFTMNVDSRTRYNLDVYLTNTNNSYFYDITVVGMQGEFTSPPVEDVQVTFEKFVAGGEYEKVGQYETDANGKFNIYLIPGTFYKVTLSKTGYDTKIEYYIPPEKDDSKEFRILPSTITQDEYDNFFGYITFDATMDNPGYLLDSNITLTYSDSNSSTTNFQIYVYDLFNDTDELIGSVSGTTSSYSGTISNINNTRLYRADLYFNNTANFNIEPPVPKMIYPKYSYEPGKTKIDIDDRIDNIIGEFEYDINDNTYNWSWATILSVILAFILFASFGVYNTGLGIIGGGFGLLLTQAIYAIHFTNNFDTTLAAIGGFVVFIGILYMMAIDKPGGGL